MSRDAPLSESAGGQKVYRANWQKRESFCVFPMDQAPGLLTLLPDRSAVLGAALAAGDA